jgi:hypothetical protein
MQARQRIRITVQPTVIRCRRELQTHCAYSQGNCRRKRESPHQSFRHRILLAKWLFDITPRYVSQAERQDDNKRDNQIMRLSKAPMVSERQQWLMP